LYSTAIESLGFKEKEARRISELVGRGSLLTVESWNISPSELESQVASKGGTTEAGLKVLRNGGSLVEAVEAAAKRAKELSKG
jgi:pyrroline-5-carboxylate reductase